MVELVAACQTSYRLHGIELASRRFLLRSIIGLLAAIAIPSFMKARASARRNACINNLRQISGAKDQYALEYGGTNGTTLNWTNVGLYIKNYSNNLFCPEAAATGRGMTNYTINTVGTDPACQILPTDASGNPSHSLLFQAK